MSPPPDPDAPDVAVPAPVPVALAPGAGTGDGFVVDPAALRRAAGCIAGEADVLGELATDAPPRLAALGACWGDDEVGRRFAAAYEPAAATVLANLQALSHGLVRIAGALGAVARAYEQVDEMIAGAATTAGGTGAP